jgi:hypothetical protein
VAAHSTPVQQKSGRRSDRFLKLNV